MKKVLIITYYWPPAGGAGVQRWVKFVKYLRNFNWEPVVYAPQNNEIPVEDHSFDKDIPDDVTILRNDIWEPYNIYKKFIGAKKHEKFHTGGFISEKRKSGLADKISIFVRGNFFIPDARKFWIKPSVKFLKAYLSENPVDIIVSTGPPHSMHLIALKLKKDLNIPWIADFRDPWTKIYMYNDLMLTQFADRKHKKLERKVLSSADCIITISETIANELKEIGTNIVKVITNGYDNDDFNMNNEITIDEKFSIIHAGNIHKSKNHIFLWQAVAELINEVNGLNDDLIIKLPGQIDFSIKETISKKGLDKYIQYYNYLPHIEIIKLLLQSRILLLMISNTKASKGVLTGKIFEYIAVKKPIIAIAPNGGEIDKILANCNLGTVCDFDNKEKLKSQIKRYYELYKKDRLYVEPTNVEKYTRYNLTKEIAEVFNKIISN